MIKGLRRSIAEGGKIKTGGLGQSKGGSTWRPPVKWDHIKVTKCEREGGRHDGDLLIDQPLMAALAKAGYIDDHDGKVRALPIMVHSDDIDKVFPTAYVRYAGKTCACRGDGEKATRFEIVEGKRTGKTKEIECPCDQLKPDADGAKRCKHSGILHCSIRLPGFAVIGSVHRWRTTSKISCEQMVGSLELLLDEVGSLRGAPLSLIVRPVPVNPVGGRPNTVFVCHVVAAEQLEVMQDLALAAALRRRELTGGRSVSSAPLELPGTEDEAEQAAVAAEYYAEAEVIGTTPSGAEVLAAPAPSGDIAKLQNPTAPSVPPAEPATAAAAEPPPPATDGKQPRQTRCKPAKGGCDQMYGPGIVKSGLCGACRERLQQHGPPPAEQAPPPTPPARPSTATTITQPPAGIGPLVTAKITQEGFPATTVLAVLRERWPDADNKADWSALEIAEAEAILAGLTK